MRAIPTALVVLSLALLPAQSLAGNDKGKTKLMKNAPVAIQSAAPGAAPCPPGLAKKNLPCIPPGQARKHRYRVGDRIISGYDILGNPARYRLDPDHTYYRVGDYLYRVDRDTGEVLNFLGALVALLD